MQSTEELSVPSLGIYQLKKEARRDRWGSMYIGMATNTKKPVLIRTLSPFVTEGTNFSLRFELLKNSITTLKHPNLVQVLELGHQNNIYYLVKELPAKSWNEMQTLKDFDPKNSNNKQEDIEHIFTGIINGLIALEEFKSPVFPDGIHHGLLVPEKVYLLNAHTPNPTAKIDGYCETFMFCGDFLHANSARRMALAQWSLTEDIHDSSVNVSARDENVYRLEASLSPGTRRGKTITTQDTQYSFGFLLYQYLTSKQPWGIFPKASEIDPALDTLWTEITEKCLSSLTQNHYKNFKDILADFKKLESTRTQLSPQEVKLRNTTPPKGMVLINIGDKVELGAKDGPPVEQPRFRARVKPFFIDINPVTCEEFSRFQSNYKRSSYSKGDKHPATLLNWQMAKAYCRWRSQQEGIDPRKGYRLPTEYEWEAATRGATGYLYPWGAEPDPKRCHCDQDKTTGSVPIKQFPPGRFGIYDMLGNVWEWTESPFKPHPFSKHVEKGYSQDLRVVKGGCWLTPLDKCRASLRSAFPPNSEQGNIGFRCVLPWSDPDEQ